MNRNNAENAAKTQVLPESGAESGALGAREEGGRLLVTSKNAGLLAVIEAWPTLPEAVKANILAIIRPAG